MPDPTEPSVCTVCGRSQPFQRAGKENLCPECFINVQRMGADSADGFLSAVAKSDPQDAAKSIVEQLADLEAKLKSEEAEYEDADAAVEDAMDRRNRAEERCGKTEDQIAILNRMVKQASLAVSA